MPFVCLAARRRACALAGWVALCAWAPSVSLAQSAAPATAVRSNLASFTATATVEVPRDLLTVTLSVVRDGTEAGTVQTQIRQIIDNALAEARRSAQPGLLEIRTGTYSMVPRYTRDGRINGWQGSGELILEGTDAARIGQVAGRLAGLNVTGVAYGFSRALREQYESRLTQDAIARFRSRAAEIATGFGFKGYEVAEISVQAGEPVSPAPVPMLRMAKADLAEAGAALPVEAGKGTLTVTVSGSVTMKP